MTYRNRTKEEQARANMLKVIRAAVRLRHAINADNELNELLPVAEKRFTDALQRGRLMEPAEVKRAIGL